MDQTTYFERWKYFSAVTNVRNCFATKQQLEEAKQIVNAKRLFPFDISDQKFTEAKWLYDSAHHPDTGEKVNLFGRMSFQVPGGMFMLGLLLQFYKKPSQVAAVQFVNQSFVSFVNYNNRNASLPTTTKQALFAYVSATCTALGVSLGLNMYSRKAPPIFARWVPYVAVLSANAVNIPLTRQNEWLYGVIVRTKSGQVVGKSKKCALKGIQQVYVSRLVMVTPGMVLIPVLMEQLNKSQWFRKISFLHLPLQMVFIGAIMSFSLPMACALYPQTASMAVTDLEPSLRESIQEMPGSSIKRVYFNKGL